MSWSGEVEICNGALSMLGAERITSLLDTSRGAILCNLFYAQCRDTTLRAYPWNFATRRKNLGAALASSDADAPVWGFAYGYSLPTTPYCLRVVEVEEDEPYRVEGRVLYSDSSTVNVRYIARIESPAQFDDLFKMALMASIAMALAMPITKSDSVFKSMGAQFEYWLEQARSIDAHEGTPDEINSDELIEARSGSYLSRSQYLAR